MNLSRLLIAVTCVALCGPQAWAQPAPTAAVEPGIGSQRPESVDLLERVFVIGSSASAGFGTPATLNLLIQPMITGEHQPVGVDATALFFLAPEDYGEKQAAAALAHKPTLVLALDYLFWFGYGNVSSESARMVLLEQGLENLERFDCPVIVGPFPVVTQAIGKIISRSEVPTDRTLEMLNLRVEEWVEERSSAYIVSVPDIYAQLMKDPPGEIAGQTWPLGEDKQLMQPDRLHPTLEGMTAVSALVLQDLVAQGLIPANRVNLDMAASLAQASGEPLPTPETKPVEPVTPAGTAADR